MNGVNSFRALLSIVLAFLILFANFSFALAGGPVFEGPFHEEGTVEIYDCGSFQLLDVYELNYTEKLFLDEQGNRVRLLEHVWGIDTLTNSVTGKAYPMSYSNNVIVDFTTTPPTGANAGIIFRLIIPGQGAVALDVGRIVVDRGGNVYFQAGPHQFVDGDLEILCEVLS